MLKFLEFCKLVNLEGAVAYSRMRLKKQLDIEEVEARIREKAFMIFLDEKIKSEGNPPSFMLTVARNTLFDYLRAINADKRKINPDVFFHQPSGNALLMNVNKEELQKLIEKIIDLLSSEANLSEKEIEALKVFYVGKFIDAKEGTKEGESSTLRVRLSRAREKIRRAMSMEKAYELLIKIDERVELEEILSIFTG